MLKVAITAGELLLAGAAFGQYQGNVTPQVVTGGNMGPYQNNNAAVSFMELMGVKAAKDLAIDFRVSKEK